MILLTHSPIGLGEMIMDQGKTGIEAKDPFVFDNSFIQSAQFKKGVGQAVFKRIRAVKWRPVL